MMKLPLPVLIVLQKTLNGILQLDPDTAPQLSAINGKMIRINVTAPPISILLSVSNGQIVLDQPSDSDCDADTTISGSLSDLRSLTNNSDALYTGQVKIEGDVHVSQQIKHIIDSVDPDWQEAVSPWLGDSLTHYLDVTQSRFGRWFKRSAESLRLNTEEYLQEEAELLAPSSEITVFCEAVDELQASLDRFAARLNRLEKQRRANAELSSGAVDE